MVLLFVRSVTEEFRTAYGGPRFSEYIQCDFLTFLPDVRFRLIQLQQISPYQDTDIRIAHYPDRFGPLGKFLREFYKINLALSYWLPNQVEYSVVAYRTSN